MLRIPECLRVSLATCTLLVAPAGTLSTGMCGTPQTEIVKLQNIVSATSRTTSLQAIPRIRICKGAKMEVEFCVANNSTRAVGYWRPWTFSGYGTVWYLELKLCESGQRIPRIEDFSMALTRDSVEVLQPGDAILCRVSLPECFGIDRQYQNLPPGLYALRAVCSITEESDLVGLGCSPMHMDQTIMLIDVVDTKEPVLGSWLGAVLLGAASIGGYCIYSRCLQSRTTNERAGSP